VSEGLSPLTKMRSDRLESVSEGLSPLTKMRSDR
jgi:hypothetical protein